ncbi:MAG: ROK family protein [Clostridia bacterium]|nr:ROK family protein [Clostridia bacterium]
MSGKFSELMHSMDEEAVRVFDILQKNGPLTKAEVLNITGMKLTTLNRVMQPMQDARLIAQTGIGESSGGRKPVLYDVNTADFLTVGIDISRLHVEVIISDIKAKIVFRERFEMEALSSPSEVVYRIRGILDKAFSYPGMERDRIIGAGLGTVGPLDRKKGTILNAANFSSAGWVDVPIRQLLEESLGLDVIIDNGANTAVLAEYLFGTGKNLKNISCFICGIGIRTGAVSCGSLVRTINDAEDAFGHMVVDVDGRNCSCGNFGCVEAYSSIPAIVNSFKAALKKGRHSNISKTIDEIRYTDICAAADGQDELAKEIIADAAVIFGTGLANFINLLNPDMVILSGPLVKHSELFYEVSTGIASRKYYLHREKRVVFMKGGYFGEDAIAVGAAAMVVENILGKRVIL